VSTALALSDPVVHDALTIRPWRDPIIDQVGFDPRSTYVETFWLGILGPSTTWLLRRLVAGLEAAPAGFDLDFEETARCLGLGARLGRHSPFVRSLARCVQFELAQARGNGELAVRRKLPPLNHRQILRLPPSLQESYRRWQDTQLRVRVIDQLRRRSRQLALSLLELGEDLESTERHLMRWRFHPALCQESAAWAWERHRRAMEAEGRADDD
jgi:hypothetical protein